MDDARAVTDRARAEWVSRVLGVTLASASGVHATAPNAQAPDADFSSLTADLAAARKGLLTARDTMTEALSKADGQIRKLQAVLAVQPDSELKEIAGSPDFGINALTGNYRVRVLAALRDLEASSPERLPPVLKRARALVDGFDGHIRSSKQLEACDQNPLGVVVGVRPLLTPALAALARSIDNFAA